MKLSYIIMSAYMLIALPQVLYAQDALTRKLAMIAIQHSDNGILPGEQIPDTSFFQVFNYNKDSTSIADFGGKLIIFDFWHQYCSTCLAQFPKLESLQKEFGNRILIMPVTFQSRGSVNAFFSQRAREGKAVSLPSIVEDTLLRKYFPHDGDPYEIWVKDGKVLGITNYSEVTYDMIESILSGKYDSLRKVTLDPTFERSRPFLIGGNGGDGDNFEYRSILTKYNPHLRALRFFHLDSGYFRVFECNYPLIQIFKDALFGFSGLVGDSMFNDIMNDPFGKRVIIDSSLHLDLDKLYCYDLVLPGDFSEAEGREFMLDNLEKCFRLQVVIEPLKLKCYKLINTSDIIDSNKNKQSKLVSIDRLHWIFINYPFDSFVAYLNSVFKNMIIIDETNDIGGISADVKLKDVSDIKSLRIALKKSGFDLKADSIDLPMLVFRPSL